MVFRIWTLRLEFGVQDLLDSNLATSWVLRNQGLGITMQGFLRNICGFTLSGFSLSNCNRVCVREFWSDVLTSFKKAFLCMCSQAENSFINARFFVSVANATPGFRFKSCKPPRSASGFHYAAPRSSDRDTLKPCRTPRTCKIDVSEAPHASV